MCLLKSIQKTSFPPGRRLWPVKPWAASFS